MGEGEREQLSREEGDMAQGKGRAFVCWGDKSGGLVHMAKETSRSGKDSELTMKVPPLGTMSEGIL